MILQIKKKMTMRTVHSLERQTLIITTKSPKTGKEGKASEVKMGKRENRFKSKEMGQFFTKPKIKKG